LILQYSLLNGALAHGLSRDLLSGSERITSTSTALSITPRRYENLLQKFQ